jgi:hypothetical protein
MNSTAKPVTFTQAPEFTHFLPHPVSKELVGFQTQAYSDGTECLIAWRLEGIRYNFPKLLPATGVGWDSSKCRFRAYRYDLEVVEAIQWMHSAEYKEVLAKVRNLNAAKWSLEINTHLDRLNLSSIYCTYGLNTRITDNHYLVLFDDIESHICEYANIKELLRRVKELEAGTSLNALWGAIKNLF